MMQHKLCKRCGLSKLVSEYRQDNRYKDGFSSWCRECHRQRNSEWAKENRERLSKKAADWRAVNREKVGAINRRYKAANAEKCYADHRAWVEKNRDKRRATNAKRKAAKLRATPKWANLSAIAKIYAEATAIQRNTGMRMHVDHIVPLQGETVCGLHCEANLQILPGPINESKRNKWPQDCSIEEAYKQPDMFITPPEAKHVQEALL